MHKHMLLDWHNYVEDEIFELVIDNSSVNVKKKYWYFDIKTNNNTFTGSRAEEKRRMA